MGFTDIKQLRPKDVYDAAIGANSPSAANVFATMADVGGGGGGGSAGTSNEHQITDNAGGFVASILQETGGQIGVGGVTTSAVFALDSVTDKGFTLPTMTVAQQTAIAAPANGLQVHIEDGTDSVPYYNHSVDGWVPVGKYANVGATVNGGIAPTANQMLVSSNTDGEINYAPYRWSVSGVTPSLYGLRTDTNAIASTNLGGSSTNTRWLTLYFRGYLDHQYGKMRWTTGSNAGAKFEQGNLRVGFTATTGQGGIIVRNDGIDTYDLDTSAMLELRSTSKGFLPPKMTTAQMNAISSPATGLMIYDTTTNQWMGYDGTSWVIIA